MEKYPLEKYKDKSIIVTPEFYYSTDLICFPKDSKKYLEKVILSHGTITDRIEKMALDIMETNPGKSITFLVIMKSALMYSNYLQKFIINHKKTTDTGFYYYEYVTISSYHDDKSKGNINIKTDESVFKSLKGKDVIIIEDMYDSGKSLDQLLKYLENFELNSVKIAMLFVKQNIENLKYNLDLDYVGFVIPPNTFIVGFGMDFNEIFRDLNHSCILSKEGFNELVNK